MRFRIRGRLIVSCGVRPTRGTSSDKVGVWLPRAESPVCSCCPLVNLKAASSRRQMTRRVERGEVGRRLLVRILTFCLPRSFHNRQTFRVAAA